MLQSQLIGTVAYGATGYFQESGPDEFLQDLECMGVRVVEMGWEMGCQL